MKLLLTSLLRLYPSILGRSRNKNYRTKLSPSTRAQPRRPTNTPPSPWAGAPCPPPRRAFCSAQDVRPSPCAPGLRGPSPLAAAPFLSARSDLPGGLSKPLESTWPARKWDSLARTPRGTVRGRHPSLQGLTSGAHAGGIICLYCHLGVHTVPRSEPPPPGRP